MSYSHYSDCCCRQIVGCAVFAEMAQPCLDDIVPLARSEGMNHGCLVDAVILFTCHPASIQQCKHDLCCWLLKTHQADPALACLSGSVPLAHCEIVHLDCFEESVMLLSRPPASNQCQHNLCCCL